MVLVKKVLCFYILLFSLVLRVNAMEQNQQMVTLVTNYSDNAEKQGYINTQTIHTGYPICSLVTAPEYNKVACTVLKGVQGLVQLYSFKNNDDTKEIESTHIECVGTGDGGLAYCNNALYSVTLKGHLKVWDVQNATVTSTHQLQDLCSTFAVTPEKMVAGNCDGTISVYSSGVGSLINKIRNFGSYIAPVTSMLCANQRVVTHSNFLYKNNILSFDLEQGKYIGAFGRKEISELVGFSSLSFTNMFLVGVNGYNNNNYHNGVMCLDYRFADNFNAIKCETSKLVTAVSSITPFAFVSGHDDGSINLWDLRSATKPVQSMKANCAKIQALACLNEKSFFSTSGSQLKLWQIK